MKAWIRTALLCSFIFLSLLAQALPEGNSEKPLQMPVNSVNLTVQEISRESVLEQAGSTDDVTNAPGHKLVFGTKKSYVFLAGQISALGFQANDGRFNRTYLGTNTISNNRFSLGSKHIISNALSIGSLIELGFRTNPSKTISQFNPSSMEIDIRHAEIYLKSEKWGQVWFGQGDTASDNTSYADLSGTEIAARSGVEDIGGGLFFNGLSSNPQVLDVFNGLDGYSRKVRIRYDTPSFGGVSLGGSLIAGSKDDLALKFGNEFSRVKVAVEVAYTSPQDIGSGTNLAHGRELNGSASILFPMGINLTGAGGQVDTKNAGRKNPYFYYIKPGYQFKYFREGLTALSVDFGRYTNFAQNSDIGNAVGAQLVQNIDSWDLVVYAAYRQFQLKRPGSSFDNMNLFIFGALYKF